MIHVLKTNRLVQFLIVGLWLLLVGFLLTVRTVGEAGPHAIEPLPVPPTQENGPDGFDFLVIGDTGSGASFQFDVAKQMMARYEQQPYTLVLHVGDIIYPSGEFRKSGDELYKKVYAPLMDKGVEFRTVLGNHDVRYGYDPGALAFYGMPDRYYHFSRGNVDFFAIDTNIMNRDEQRQWLDEALAKSDARWKIVYGHHPIHSSGQHGPNTALSRRLAPLLIKHGVDFYIAGHEHNYERFEPIRGVVHLVSGGGGAWLRSFAKEQPHSKVRLSTHHFLDFQVRGDTIRFQAVDKTGRVIDAEVFRKQPAIRPLTRDQKLKPAA